MLHFGSRDMSRESHNAFPISRWSVPWWSLGKFFVSEGNCQVTEASLLYSFSGQSSFQAHWESYYIYWGTQHCAKCIWVLSWWIFMEALWGGHIRWGDVLQMRKLRSREAKSLARWGKGGVGLQKGPDGPCSLCREAFVPVNRIPDVCRS